MYGMNKSTVTYRGQTYLPGRLECPKDADEQGILHCFEVVDEVTATAIKVENVLRDMRMGRGEYPAEVVKQVREAAYALVVAAFRALGEDLTAVVHETDPLVFVEEAEPVKCAPQVATNIKTMAEVNNEKPVDLTPPKPARRTKR